ncbi:MAG TPA: hypothetical protein VGT99_00925 [Gammaproteobacteria bacterium]|nr:hypothetical protein [Gammaproteobacteria bacterium]
MKRSKYDPKLDPKNFPKPAEAVPTPGASPRDKPAPKTPAAHAFSYTRATDIVELQEERERAKAAHMGYGVRASEEITLRDHQRAERERQAARSHYQGAPLHLVHTPGDVMLKPEGGRVVVPMLRAADTGPTTPAKPKN